MEDTDFEQAMREHAGKKGKIARRKGAVAITIRVKPSTRDQLWLSSQLVGVGQGALVDDMLERELARQKLRAEKRAANAILSKQTALPATKSVQR